jgi:heterotetrameric sarcosine oxidase delta subunit
LRLRPRRRGASRFGPGSSDDDFEAYLFLRPNVKGVHFERWRHAMGCGKWFLAARDTATLEVFGTYPRRRPNRPPTSSPRSRRNARIGRDAMSTRLARGGRLIDRARKVEFTFNGKRFFGHPGDTLASALMANGQRIVGRSFKYHRPRGIVASGGEEPNALVNLGQGDTA